MEKLLVQDVKGHTELEGYVGKSVAQIAEEEGKHPVDAMLDVAVAGNLEVEFLGPDRGQNADHMAAMINDSMYTFPGVSDGGAHTKFLTTGSYPTEFLATWVRDHEVMDLEQAHWKLSAYSAQTAGLRDRGSIAEGMPADIVVYDLEALELLPAQRVADWPAGAWRLDRRARGWRWTIVNGEITFEDGECVGATPGRLLRHGHC